MLSYDDSTAGLPILRVYLVFDMVDSDSRLDALIRCARAHVGALDRLFQRYRPYPVQAARRRIGSRLAVRCDVSVIVQQTSVEAPQPIPSFRDSSEPEFSAWIRRIHEHNVAETVRKNVQAARQSINHEQSMMDQDGSASCCW